ncbi:ABC transporter permease [Roseomonas sp. KE2513]|uniref:ABC transporter permease n=1 Tax=Roseomonas sp. KE2513 TaxID=2479202 RepID=UPI0018DFF110|nr:ABC transporter permease [Roseomonas sp. KE2513]MBI0537208.1 ABC transporter permease [Roseomonas sp. KE2513]
MTLSRLIARRTIEGIATLAVIAVLLFGGVELIPGDPARTILGQSVTEEAVRNLRVALRLDQPVHERFLSWVEAAAQGDLGTSILNGRPVAPDFAWRAKNTLFLAGYAAAMSIPLSIMLGLLAALYRDRLLDRAISLGSLATISFPEFFVGYVLLTVFALNLGWFPVLSSVTPEMGLAERLSRCFLPAVTLSCLIGAYVLRITRAAVVSILSRPYIEMAELKGASRTAIVLRHALVNAVGPIANVVALALAYMVVGIVVTEVVFTYPGLGQWMVDSVAKHDMNVILVCGLAFGATYVGLNVLADIAAALASPRLRHPR